jgi:hypothetical protein
MPCPVADPPSLFLSQQRAQIENQDVDIHEAASRWVGHRAQHVVPLHEQSLSISTWRDGLTVKSSFDP